MQDRNKNGKNEMNAPSYRGVAASAATIVEGLSTPMPDTLRRALAAGLEHPVATREADLRSAWQLIAD